MNPAVTVALACVGKFPWKSLLHYLPAQYLGAWLGSALVLLTYKDAIDYHYAEQDVSDWGMDTAGIFVTSPNAGVTNLGGAIDQVRQIICEKSLNVFIVETVSGCRDSSPVIRSQCCGIQEELQDVHHHWTSAGVVPGDGHWHMFWSQCRVFHSVFITHLLLTFVSLPGTPSTQPETWGQE